MHHFDVIIVTNSEKEKILILAISHKKDILYIVSLYELEIDVVVHCQTV